ncbi:MAG: hypothetical protein ACOCXA_00310 [Planctomycetota bacterium]
MKTRAITSIGVSLRSALVPSLLLALAGSGGALHAAEAGADGQAQDPADEQSTADQQLEALAAELRRANADRDALAAYHHDLGMRAVQEGDLPTAIRHLTLAVDYSDGNNAAYQRDLDRAAALAGTSRDPREVYVDDIVNAKLVEEQRLWVEIQERIEAGMSHLAAQRYNQAHQSFSMALVRLESLSYADERRAEQMARVQQLIQESEERRKAAEQARAAADLAEASQRQQALRAREMRLEQQRIDAMLARAKMARERREYDEAILYCEQILKINPAEERAHDLLVRSRRERHVYVRQMTAVEWDEQHKRLSEEIREAMLPQFETVVYSEDWHEIDRMRSTPSSDRNGEGESWRDEVRQELRQQLTLEFVDAEISDVVEFLQQNTGVNIVLDPEVVASGDVPPITMQVDNIRMENALEFIMTLTGLRYVLRDEALYISNESGVQGDSVMKIYDIADLTHPLTDFPGPRMRIPDPGDESAQLVQEIVPDDEDITVDYFIEIIESVVARDTWRAMEGVSIGEHNNQMVVTHTPDVHKQIERLLHTLRNQRGLQINVAVKWLTVEDGTLERIAVNLLGYQVDEASGIGITPSAPNAANANGPGNLGIYENNLDDFYVGTVNNRTLPDGWYDPTFFSSGSVLSGGLNTQYQVYEDPNGLLGSVVAEAIEQSRRGNVSIEPNITLFNGQRAHVVDLVQEAYIADYDVAGGQFDPVVSVISYGTVLDVRGIASADRKYITLTLRPTTSNLESFFEFAISTDTLFFPIEYPIKVPRLSFEAVETTVTIPDGGSILLAGLTNASSGRAHSGIPFLSHIPFLGRLFSSNARSEAERKTIISVKADIVLFDELEAKL